MVDVTHGVLLLLAPRRRRPRGLQAGIASALTWQATRRHSADLLRLLTTMFAEVRRLPFVLTSGVYGFSK